MIILAVTCLLLAAKLEEHISPSYERMIRLVKSLHKVSIKKIEIRDLEEQIIKRLDFGLRSIYSIQFLERYVRLLGVD